MKKTALTLFLLLTTIVYGVKVSDGFLLEGEEEYYEKQKELPLLETVGALRAVVIDDTRVFLTWDGLSEGKVIYTVYRSRRPINTYTAYSEAVKVGEVIDEGKFIDTTITETGIYYYAVTTRGEKYKENLRPIKNENYMNRGLEIVLTNGKRVRELSASPVNAGIKVGWQLPDSATNKLMVFRSYKKINTFERLKGAVLLARVKDTDYYLDQDDKSGPRYYAVLYDAGDGSPVVNLKADVNYTSYPVYGGKIEDEPEEETSPPAPVYQTDKIELFKAVAESKGNRISWVVKEFDSPFLVLRTGKKPQGLKDLASATVLGKIKVKSGNYLDKDGSSGDYYLLIPPGYSSMEELKILPGYNLASVEQNPGYSKNSDKINQNDYNEIDEIFRKIYKMDDFAPVEAKLLSIAETTSDPKLKARAYFYIGRIRVEEGAYTKALDFFYREDVQNYYSDEAKFWQDYCLVQIK